MNRKLIAAAVLAATSLGTTAAFADEAKHGYGFRNGYPVAPVYVAPRYVAPIANHRYLPPVSYNYGHGHGYGHNHGYGRGYWSNGRWIAPVIIGAAVLGTVAAANHYYAPPVVTYVNPVPTYNTTYVNAPAVCDTFCQADRDQNGVVDKVEASFDRTWEKWFYDIDRNNDGVITRQEVADWNRIRATGRY
jgi:hypothetical protein